jgi:hypothetical protein
MVNTAMMAQVASSTLAPGESHSLSRRRTLSVAFSRSRERNGGWGQQVPTLEETAYVVSRLVSLLKQRHGLLSAPSMSSLPGP